MEYMGFDYHKQYSFVTSINKITGEIRQAKLSNTPEALDSFIRNGKNTYAVLESSRTWPVLYNILKDRVAEVKLAHPLRVKAIASARIKNDRIDSRVLAELLASDLIPESHIRGDRNRDVQMVLRQRVFFVTSRTRIKNRIHYLVDRLPYHHRKQVEHLSDLFGKEGMEWLRSSGLFSKDDRILLDQLLGLLDNLNSLIKQSDKIIEKIASEDKYAQLLQTVPGIGKFLAVLISTEIDDINRFRSADKLASYTGLIPSTYASGGVVRHGRITKQGNRWLRWAFVEVAQSGTIYNLVIFIIIR